MLKASFELFLFWFVREKDEGGFRCLGIHEVATEVTHHSAHNSIKENP